MWHFSLLSVSNFLCCNIFVKEQILICYNANCCFTLSHNQGLLLTGPPWNEIHSLFHIFSFFFFYCLCYLSEGLLTKTRLPVGWPDRWLGRSLEAGTNEGEWYESFSMNWWILLMSYELHWACTLDAESSFNKLLGRQAWHFLGGWF